MVDPVTSLSFAQKVVAEVELAIVDDEAFALRHSVSFRHGRSLRGVYQYGPPQERPLVCHSGVSSPAGAN